MNKGRYLYCSILILSLLLIVAGVLGSTETHIQDQIVISEICPHNKTIISDPMGDYSDYLVITNVGDRVVNMEGYSLTDDKENFDKYCFPNMDISPGERVIVWSADTEFYGAFIEREDLFTGFAIRDGETIYLINPHGEVVDKITTDTIPVDMAFIRDRDEWIIGNPAEKKAEDYHIDEGMAKPVFSRESGAYSKPFWLSISGEGEEVYYTIDGSNPYAYGKPFINRILIQDQSEKANKYASIRDIAVMEPIYIPDEPVQKCMVIRAVTKSQNGCFSEETVGTYFIGDGLVEDLSGNDTISIVVNPEDLFSDERGIYVNGSAWKRNKDKEEDFEVLWSLLNYDKRGEGWYRNAEVELFNEDGKRIYSEEVKISIHGSVARLGIQKGFSLRPVKTNGEVFEGLIEDGKGILDIRSGASGDRESNVRDVLINRLTSNMAIGSTENIICCNVFINGEYWGCYNLEHHLDEKYVSNVFNVAADNVNLIKKGVPRSGEEKDQIEYDRLVDYVSRTNMKDQSNFDELCKIIDMDSMIDYYSVLAYIANTDYYINNFAMWKARSDDRTTYGDGKWRFIMFDTDGSCNRGSDEEMYEVMMEKDPFFSNVAVNSGFRDRFLSNLEELAKYEFSYAVVEGEISSLEKIYTKPMVQSHRRYGQIDYDEEEYYVSLKEIRSFFENRGEEVIDFWNSRM